MQQIFNFLIRHKNTLLFLLLLSISLFFTVQSHQYHKSKFISSTNFLTAGVYKHIGGAQDYFHLKDDNQKLLEENKALRMLLTQYQSNQDTVYTDTSSFAVPYTFISAKVIRNQYNKLDNSILIAKGEKDSVTTDLGVITSKGIVGVIEKSSKNYARIISILNTNLSVSAQLKKTEHFGSLVWDGKSPNVLQLHEIPRLAPVQKGDTIITSGKSLIFPKGVPIGIVTDFELDQNDNYGKIDVRLFNDMTNIGYVYIIKNNNRPELEELMQDDE